MIEAKKELGGSVISLRHVSKSTYLTTLFVKLCDIPFLHIGYPIENGETQVKALEDIHLYEGSEVGPILKGEFGKYQNNFLKREIVIYMHVVILRGPSGGGKTTLLNMLGTIDTPTGGEIGKIYSAQLTYHHHHHHYDHRDSGTINQQIVYG